MATKTTTKWKTSDVSRIGRGALALALEQRAALEPRLAPGLLDGLSADLDAFEGKRSAATLASEALREATRTQDAAAKAAHEFLIAARAAIARSGATAAQRTAFGLQIRMRPEKVSSVVAGLDAFLDAATRYPDVARGAGLLPSDLDHARALRAALVAADAAQEAKKQSRKTPTAERTQLQRRIEQAVDAIVAAGTLAFVLDPARAARFRALVPSYGKGKGKRSPAAPATTPA
jgi:hypothetical protein